MAKGHNSYPDTDSRMLRGYTPKFPDPPLLPKSVNSLLLVKRIQVLAEGVMDATALLFFEQQRETPSEPWSSRQLRKIAGGLRDLNVRIEQKEFFVDDCFSLADISVASVLGMQDMLEQTGVASGLQSMAPSIVDWRAKYPLLERFYTQLSMRPSVKSTAPMMFELSETVV